MADIFISYARADKDKAKILAEALGKQNWNLWWDPKIPAGKTFDEEIEKALAKAKCVIVLWSKTSVNSRWVRTEASEGAERKILVPVLLDSVVLPLEFKRIQAVDLRLWKGDQAAPEYQGLLRDISDLLYGRTADSSTRYEVQKPIQKPIVTQRTDRKAEKFQKEKERISIYDYFHDIVLIIIVAIPGGAIFWYSLFKLIESGYEIYTSVLGQEGQSVAEETLIQFILSCIGVLVSAVIANYMKRFIRVVGK